MTDHNDTSTTKTTPAHMTILTEGQYAKVNEALATLYSVVANMPTKEGVEVHCKETDSNAVLARTAAALDRFQTYKSREVLRTAKKGVDGVCWAARQAAVAGYREIAGAIAKMPMLKVMLGDKANPPTSTSIPLAEVRSFFPTGMKDADIVTVLHKMNYSLVKGPRKEEGHRISVPISSEVLAKLLKEDTGAEVGETEETEENIDNG